MVSNANRALWDNSRDAVPYIGGGKVGSHLVGGCVCVGGGGGVLFEVGWNDTAAIYLFMELQGQLFHISFY